MRSILGIDTASPEGSVALEIDGAPAGLEALSAGGYSSGLSAAVGRLLAARQLAIGSLSGIAVSEGPGSFTGLRIGLAWAKGVALGSSLRLALVSAHEAAAHAHRDATNGDAKARVATVTQGERGFVVAALWNPGNPGDPASPAWGPEAAPEDEFMERLLEAAGGALVLVAAPTDALSEAVLDLGGTLLPRRALALAVAALGDRAIREGRFADLSSAAPAYGRAPNARKPGSLSA
jgi:tRNA threonylcarbamoyladenosine biosynthesis protein TsaB